MRTLAAFALILLAAACHSTSTTPATHNVVMRDYVFDPESLNISVGDTVTWVNQGYYEHTATSGTVGNPDGQWDSGVVAPGGTYRRVFTAGGNFHYYCSLHGATQGMKGVISVH